MPRPGALVDRVSSLSTVAEGPPAVPGQEARTVAVAFEGGRSGLLDMGVQRSRVWAEIIESRRQAGLPVYVEIDPSTNLIADLLLPQAVRVEALTPDPSGDVEVRLIISAALHYLRRGNPDFQVLLNALQSARNEKAAVLVTEVRGTHEIIDVRPLPPSMAAPAAPVAGPPAMETPPPPVTPERAQELFALVSPTTCDPVNAVAPCIPFLYPDDGCWARAHEMCRLMIADGAQPAKVWIYGSLHVRSANKPAEFGSSSCHVYWGWHVAPTILTAMPGGTETMVIDPSIFTEPVRLEQWKRVQGDTNASLEASDAAVFHRSQGGAWVTYDDAAYTQTKADLQYYRLELVDRSALSGPPPYAVCQADVYLRDNLQDTGAEPLPGGGISVSPDINHYRQELADPQGTLGGAAAEAQDWLFETLEIGQPNYIYLRLQNRGLAAAPVDGDIYYGPPSTLPTPASWHLIGSLATPPIVPGEFKVVGPLRWNDVPQQGHYCFVAVLGNATDPKPDLSSVHTIDDFYSLIREHNNVTWKNFDTDDVFAGSQMQYEFWIQGWPRIAYLSDLEIDPSRLPSGSTVELRLLKRLVQGAAIEGMAATKETDNYVSFATQAQKRAAVRNMPLKTSDRSQATLTVTLPAETPDGAYEVSVLQKVAGQEMGRVTKRMLVGEYPYVGNSNSGEVHVANCVWAARMSPRHRSAYRELPLALKHGYNGCRYCLPEADTG